MKRFVFLLSIFAVTSVAQAQYRFDWGISLGAANYLGDIGGTTEPRNDLFQDIKISETRYAVGGYYRAQFTRSISASASFMMGRIEGWDANTEYKPRRGRNLNFRNEIKELALKAELTLFTENDVGGRGFYNPDFKLYAFAGIAGFHHNPQGRYKEEWHELQPLRTEGQEEAYSKFGMAIPMGFGFYFTHLRKHRFSWEFGYRVTNSDYLDDISGQYAYDEEIMTLNNGGETGELAVNLANQSSFEWIDDVYGNASEYYNYGYSDDQIALGARNQRGINDNNDGYMFMTVSYGRVLQTNSKYNKRFSKVARYKSKFKRNTRRSASRRSRAKF